MARREIRMTNIQLQAVLGDGASFRGSSSCECGFVRPSPVRHAHRWTPTPARSIIIGGLVYFAVGYWRNYVRVQEAGSALGAAPSTHTLRSYPAQNEYGVIELPNKDFW